MVKSPIEYFQEQDFSMNDASGQDISPSERAFLKKYLGIDDVSALRELPPVEGVPVAGLALSAVREAAARSEEDAPPAESAESIPSAAPAGGGAARDETAGTGAGYSDSGHASELATVPSLDARLQEQEHVTLVGFYVAGDVYVVPIDAVIEVIRYEEPFKLPMAPAYMSGVVNLRGRILPVVRLADLLIQEGRRKAAAAAGLEGGKNSLIIICEGRGLQVGLLVDKLHTMFKARQSDLNWNAEAHLGPSAELLSGLLETGEKLLGVVSVERLVDKLLEA